MAKSMERSFAYQVQPSVRASLIQSLLELLANNEKFATVRIAACCVAYVARATLQLGEDISIIHDFISQALACTNHNVQQAAAQIVVTVAEFNLGCIEQFGLQTILDYVQTMIKLSATHDQAFASICNIIGENEQCEQDLGSDAVSQLMGALFQMVQDTQDVAVLRTQAERVNKMLELNGRITQTFIDDLINYSTFLVERDPSLVQFGVLIFGNTADPYYPWAEYTQAQIERLETFTVQHVISELENVDPAAVHTFQTLENPEDFYDQNSDEQMYKQVVSRMYGRYTDQTWDTFSAKFANLQSYGQMHACLWCIDGILSSDKSRPRHVLEALKIAKSMAAQSMQLLPFIQYKSFEILAGSFASYDKEVIKELQNCETIIEQCFSDGFSNQGLVSLLSFVAALISSKQFKLSQKMVDILKQIPGLLQNDSLQVQCNTLDVMQSALKLGSDEIEADYMQYVLPLMETTIQKAEFVSQAMQPLEAKYYISLIFFVEESMQAYKKFEDIKVISYQVISTLSQLLGAAETEFVTGLSDSLVSFAQDTLSVYPEAFSPFAEIYAAQFMKVLTTPSYRPEKLFEESKNIAVEHLADTLKLTYVAMARFFRYMPAISAYAQPLMQALADRHEDSSAFSFAQQATTYCWLPNCYEGEQQLQIILQVQEKFEANLQRPICAATLEQMFHDYGFFAEISARAGCGDEFVLRMAGVINIITLRIEVEFRTYLVKKSYEMDEDSELDDSMPVDYERDEVCKLGETMGSITETLLGLSSGELKGQICSELTEFAREHLEVPIGYHVINKIAHVAGEEARIALYVEFVQVILEKTGVAFRSELQFVIEAIVAVPELQGRQDVIKAICLQTELLGKEKSHNIKYCQVIMCLVMTQMCAQGQLEPDKFAAFISKMVGMNGMAVPGIYLANEAKKPFWVQQEIGVVLFGIGLNCMGAGNITAKSIVGIQETIALYGERSQQLNEFVFEEVLSKIQHLAK